MLRKSVDNKHIPLLTGVLTKRGRFVKSWNSRYFELFRNELVYYTCEGGIKKGSFTISNSTVYEEALLQHFCFSLTDPNTGHQMYLACPDGPTKDQWSDAIQEIIVSSNRKGRRLAVAINDHAADLIYSPKSTIYFKIIEAQNLLDKTKPGSSDPYVTIQMGNSIVKTTTRKDTLDPQWGMIFQLEYDHTMRYAKVEVWDDLGGKDDFLGLVMIPVYALGNHYSDSSWYELCKRSPRSHVRGKILIEMHCKRALSAKYEPIRIFRKAQLLPELSCNVKSFRDERFSSDAHEQESLEYAKIMNPNAFPHHFPPLEAERFEDVAIKVSILAVSAISLPEGLEQKYILIDGILFLTNFRLIFASLARLANSIDAANDNEVVGCSVNAEIESISFSTQIYIGSIMHTALVCEEIGVSGVTGCFDIWRLKVNDGRKISFVFHESNSSYYTGSTSTQLHGEAAPASETNFENPILQHVAKKGLQSIMHVAKKVQEHANSIPNLPQLFDPNSHAVENNHDVLNTLNCILNDIAKNPDGNFMADEVEFLPLDHLLNICAKLDGDALVEGDPAARLHQAVELRIINRDHDKENMIRANEKLINVIQNSLLEPGMDCTMYAPDSGWCMDDGDEEELTKSDSNHLTAKDLSDSLTTVPMSMKMQLQIALYGGWCAYNPLDEFKRMGVPNEQWRMTSCNSSYQMCTTYPQQLFVPATADDSLLISAAGFRSRGRVPALCWRDTKTLCTICRSSQPLVGFGRRSAADEGLIAEINHCSGPQIRKRQYVIVDARPLINAQANQAAGKGYESEKCYENCRVMFMGIPNIHVIRKSYEVILEECSSHTSADYSSWIRALETSGWLAHLHKILAAVVRIVHYVSIENISVLVHCSDGWDRTAQLTSLSMMLLDPFYRTLNGFIVLIEKEWFSFGHQFGRRHGWTEHGWKDQERSPIFIQFLDCVYQCIRQHPLNYEFSEALLVFLADHVGSGWFGNFFGNCECDRKHLKESSVSIWVYVLNNRDLYINPNYPSDCNRIIMLPVASPKKIVLWDGWFLRWHDKCWNVSWVEANEEKGTNVSQALSQTGKDDKVNWVSDKSATQCHRCKLKFSLYFRKHHCRSCGLIFCEHCTNYQRVVVAVSPTKPQRVCLECSRKIDTMLVEDTAETTGKLDADGNIVVVDKKSNGVGKNTFLNKFIPSEDSRATMSSIMSNFTFGAESIFGTSRISETKETTVPNLKVSRPQSRKYDALGLDIPMLPVELCGIDEDDDNDDEDEVYAGMVKLDSKGVLSQNPHSSIFLKDAGGNVLRKRSNSNPEKHEKEAKHISGRYVPIDMNRIVPSSTTVPPPLPTVPPPLVQTGKVSRAGALAVKKPPVATMGLYPPCPDKRNEKETNSNSNSNASTATTRRQNGSEVFVNTITESGVKISNAITGVVKRTVNTSTNSKPLYHSTTSKSSKDDDFVM